MIGSADEASSPTFALVNEYRAGKSDLIYHIDLYRIDSLEEANQIGIGEYLYSGQWVLIEWPEVILSAVFPPFATLAFEVDGRWLSQNSYFEQRITSC